MAFGFSRKITIDRTKCGSADTANFPVLFAGTYAGSGNDPDLRTVANGGSVQHASGYDIYFYSDAALTTRIPAERVEYTATTGKVQFHVKVANLTVASDTVFYIAYGDSGISSDPNSDATYGKTSTWQSDFKLVTHMADGTTLSVADSTSNANNGTNSGAAATSGKVGGAADYNSADPDYTDFGNAASVQATTNISCVAWINMDSFGGFGVGRIFSKRAAGGNGWEFCVDDGIVTSDSLLFNIQNSNYSSTANIITTGTWYRAGVTFDGTTVRFYLNGSAVGTPTGSTITDSGTNLYISRNVGFGLYFDGRIDEAYYAATNILSASWFTADYNNQNSPSTFYTISSNSSSSITPRLLLTGVGQ